MSGLGSVNKRNVTYLHIVGGYIWDKRKDESDPNFAKQEYPKADGSTGVRQGAQYADLTGKVVDVKFRQHDKYGESINVTVDTDDCRYIISLPTNNRYSTCMMQFLLLGNLSEEVFIEPYDFAGDNDKRATGISFRQNGEKLSLRLDDTPSEDKDWWKKASKKDIKRFFEDLNDWFVAEVEEKVCSQFSTPEDREEKEEITEDKPKAKVENEKVEETVDEKEEVKVSPIKMKKVLRAYIKENYEGEKLPNLSKEQLVIWYNLSLNEEELPIGEDEEQPEAPKADVSDDDLDSQLDALMF